MTSGPVLCCGPVVSGHIRPERIEGLFIVVHFQVGVWLQSHLDTPFVGVFEVSRPDLSRATGILFVIVLGPDHSAVLPQADGPEISGVFGQTRISLG